MIEQMTTRCILCRQKRTVFFPTPSRHPKLQGLCLKCIRSIFDCAFETWPEMEQFFVELVERLAYELVDENIQPKAAALRIA